MPRATRCSVSSPTGCVPSSALTACSPHQRGRVRDRGPSIDRAAVRRCATDRLRSDPRADHALEAAPCSSMPELASRLAHGELTLWELVSRAGASIHDLKRRGRLPRIVVFEEAAHGEILDTLALSLDLRAALKRDAARRCTTSRSWTWRPQGARFRGARALGPSNPRRDPAAAVHPAGGELRA